MLTVERVFVPDQVNLILNDPSVRPHIGGDGKSYSDATRFTDDENCWLFLCSDKNGIGAAFIVVPHCEFLYECHTQALPHFRGRQCLRAAKICIDAIFNQTECKELFGRTPKDNLAANRFNALLGFKNIGAFESLNQNIWSLRRELWA